MNRLIEPDDSSFCWGGDWTVPCTSIRQLPCAARRAMEEWVVFC